MANGTPSTFVWPHANHVPRLDYLPPSTPSPSTPGTWRCLVRRLSPPGEWTSLEPASPGHLDPVTAAQEASTRLTTLLASRVESLAVECLSLLKSDRLRRADLPEEEGGGLGWEAQDGTGKWKGEVHSTPEGATKSVGRARTEEAV